MSEGHPAAVRAPDPRARERERARHLGPWALLGLAGVMAGCDLRLGEPRLLWLLWLVPALAAFSAYSIERRRRLTARLAPGPLVARLAVGARAGRLWLKAALVLLAATALVLALAEPKYGFAWEDVQRRGVDLVIALDVSDSMLVSDSDTGEPTTRLTRAKREITDLLIILDGDRVALVAFAGAAFVECPLTLDYGAVGAFLDDMDTESISAKGTDLGAAIRASLEALESSAVASRAVILITDGEDTTGEARRAAEEAKEQGVRIFAIGIGRDDGAPIPGPDGSFRRDRRGELVLSKLDEAALQDIALTTGGTYVRSVTGDVDLETVYRQGIKRTLADRELEARRRQRWHERYQWFVGLALGLLAIEVLIPERVRRPVHGRKDG